MPGISADALVSRSDSAFLYLRMLEGDALAETELMEYFNDQIFRIALARTHDADIANDLRPETLLRLLLACRPESCTVLKKLKRTHIAQHAMWLGNTRNELLRQRRLLVSTYVVIDCPSLVEQTEFAEKARLVVSAVAELKRSARRIVALTAEFIDPLNRH